LTAGQALRHKATLVTANSLEFARVRGLRLQDWTTLAR
jgi:predicted nucleic acid-binding protein